MTSLFNIDDIPGHLSYLTFAISYYLTNIFWLRVTAVAGILLELVYFYLADASLYAGIGWGFIFIAINGYQLARLVQQRRSLELPPADAPILHAALQGLDDSQIAQLLSAGKWLDVRAGDSLIRQGEPVTSLFFICSGLADVIVDQRSVAQLQKGSFAGEIAYLTQNPASATVTISKPARVLVLSNELVHRVTADDDKIAASIYQLLGRDLATKVKFANEQRTKSLDSLSY
jgi:hypothetical protein